MDQHHLDGQGAGAGVTVGIVGLGTMGLGIAQVYAAAGMTVLATDAAAAARDTALDRLAAGLDPRVQAGKMTPEARDAILSRVCVVPRPQAMGGAGLVIEAVVERIDVKQALFAMLETVLSHDAVLATNTSSLPVGDMAQGLRCPERLLGLHFFNPAPVMKLVELVAHAGTSDAALTRARALTEAAGKIAIACPDRPGFIVNRCARPYYGEALALLEEGRSAAEIDAAMMVSGYRLGPFSLIDLVGADINLAATEGLSAAMGHHPRYHVFDALTAQVASGALGRKTGRGFTLGQLAVAAPADAADIALRIESTLVNEAAWLLAEGGTTEDGIDTALKLGLNFPRGPFDMLAHHGVAAVRAMLAGLETRTPYAGRYAPAPLLRLP